MSLLDWLAPRIHPHTERRSCAGCLPACDPDLHREIDFAWPCEPKGTWVVCWGEPFLRAVSLGGRCWWDPDRNLPVDAYHLQLREVRGELIVTWRPRVAWTHWPRQGTYDLLETGGHVPPLPSPEIQRDIHRRFQPDPKARTDFLKEKKRRWMREGKPYSPSGGTSQGNSGPA